MTRSKLTTLILTGTVLTGQVMAADSGRYLNLITENDIYAPAGQDRHYSNGMHLGVYSEQAQLPALLSRLTLLNQRNGRILAGYALAHHIYTPQFFLSPDPQPDDRPYAGWLYGEYGLSVATSISENAFSLGMGVVGPWALGEQIQKLNHRLIGDPLPQGWDHQLHNEPTLQLRYRHSRFMTLLASEDIHVGLIHRYSAALGNVFIDAGAGLALRLGSSAAERDAPLTLPPGISAGVAGLPVRNGKTDWVVQAGVTVRAVARNLFLDGNTFRDSASVEREHVVTDLTAGITLALGEFKRPMTLGFTLVRRGKEFAGQRGADSYGSATLGIHF